MCVCVEFGRKHFNDASRNMCNLQNSPVQLSARARAHTYNSIARDGARETHRTSRGEAAEEDVSIGLIEPNAGGLLFVGIVLGRMGK